VQDLSAVQRELIVLAKVNGEKEQFLYGNFEVVNMAIPGWRATMKKRTMSQRKFLKKAGPVERWAKRGGALSEWAKK